MMMMKISAHLSLHCLPPCFRTSLHYRLFALIYFFQMIISFELVTSSCLWLLSLLLRRAEQNGGQSELILHMLHYE